jgi:hypothetical protein
VGEDDADEGSGDGKGNAINTFQWDERREPGSARYVVSLDVPMSPKLVNVRHRYALATLWVA